MKTVIAGAVYVLKSELTKAEIEKVMNYDPKALTLFDEKENPVFAISFGKAPQVTRFGVVYNDVTNDEAKHACITLPLPKGENAEDFVVDKLLPILDKVNEIEARIPGVIAEIDAKRQAVAEAIDVLA